MLGLEVSSLASSLTSSLAKMASRTVQLWWDLIAGVELSIKTEQSLRYLCKKTPVFYEPLQGKFSNFSWQLANLCPHNCNAQNQMMAYKWATIISDNHTVKLCWLSCHMVKEMTKLSLSIQREDFTRCSNGNAAIILAAICEQLPDSCRCHHSCCQCHW